jgi:hypothetical protein
MPGEEPTESTTFSPAGPVAERPAAAGQPFGNEVITVQPSHSTTTTTTAFVPSADRQPQQTTAGGGQRDGEEEEEEDADREDGGLAKTTGGECCPDCMAMSFQSTN